MSTISELEAAAPSCHIHNEGYTLEFDDRGAYGTIRFWFDHEDLNAFRATVSGTTQTFTYPGGSTASRVVPLKHPDEVNAPNCYADSVRIYPAPNTAALPWVPGTEGEEQPLGEYGWEIWFADVHFSTPSYAYDGDTPLVTLSSDVGSEAVTRPGSAYAFLSDGFPINHNVALKIPTIHYALTFHRVPYLDTTLFESLVGKVNNPTFMGRPIGTVRFDGLACSGEQTIGGSVSFEPTLLIAYRRVPHNQIMRADGGGLEVTTPLIYEEADLNTLFY